MWISAVVRKAVLLLNLAKPCLAVVVVQVIEHQNIYPKDQKCKLLLIKPYYKEIKCPSSSGSIYAKKKVSSAESRTKQSVP